MHDGKLLQESNLTAQRHMTLHI